MIKRNLVLPVLLALTITAGASEPWQIGPRSLPPPGGASQALRESIASSPQPDVTASKANAPTTKAQWQVVQAVRAKAQAVDLAAVGKQLNITITRDSVAGVPVHRVKPATVNPANRERLFVYIHGGAYVFGGGDKAVQEGAIIASVAGIPVLSIDYRMPPDHPYPAAVDDVEAVYRDLLKTHAPGAIGIGGSSAGGGLTLAAVHRLKSVELPVPGALYLGTPWADLTDTSDSLHTLEGIDRVLVTYYGTLKAAALLYANGTNLKHPEISPVYGDFAGFPATYLVTGTRDMFLSDSARTHRKLRSAGVVADLNVYEGVSHAEYATVAGSPEFQQNYGELATFLMRHLQ